MEAAFCQEKFSPSRMKRKREGVPSPGGNVVPGAEETLTDKVRKQDGALFSDLCSRRMKWSFSPERIERFQKENPAFSPGDGFFFGKICRKKKKYCNFLLTNLWEGRIIRSHKGKGVFEWKDSEAPLPLFRNMVPIPPERQWRLWRWYPGTPLSFFRRDTEDRKGVFEDGNGIGIFWKSGF